MVASLSPRKSPSHGVRPLTNYFTASSSPRKRAATIINLLDTENHSNGLDPPYTSATCVGTAAFSLRIDESSLDTVTALMRISSAQETPQKLKFRAGDEGIFLLRENGIMGRDLAVKKVRTPKQLKTRKIHLGITCGGNSGVSRKQLEVRKLRPLKIKQFDTATNQVYIRRFNQLLNKMDPKEHRMDKGTEITLKPGDVIEMDGGKRQYEPKREPDFVFRVVDCLVPRHTGNSKKLPFAVVAAPPPRNTLDLLVSSQTSRPKKRPFAITTTASPSVTFDLARSDDENKRAKPSHSRKSMDSVKTVGYPRTSEDTHNTELVLSSQDKMLSSQPSSTADPKVVNKTLDHKPREKTKVKSSHRRTEPAQDSPFSARKTPQSKIKAIASPRKKKLFNLRSTARTIQLDNVKVDNVKSETVASRPKTVPQVSPKVGDQFRVLLKTTDGFQKMRETWWYAKVIKATRERGSTANNLQIYKLKVLCRDNSKAVYLFPHDDDIQQLEEDCTSILHALVPTRSGVTKEVAFDTNPVTLSLGDLVDAHYQNGAVHDKWYRGRIAAVDGETNTCTILYLDEDVEAGVPLGQGKIVLVERGNNAAWLKGMDVYDEFVAVSKNMAVKIKKTKRKVGSVNKIEVVGDQIFVVLESISGGFVQKEERFEYTEFVSYLFESALMTYASVKIWPATKRATAKRTRTRKKVALKEEEGAVTAKDDTQTKSARVHEKSNDTMEKVVKHSRSAKAKKEFKEEEWDISKNVESLEIKEDSTDMKEMQQTLSSSYFRALNSSDPLIGADLLIQTLHFKKRGMNANFGRSIRGLLCDGPSSEGTLFPDEHRIEAALSYLDALMETRDGENNLSKSCSPDDWSTFHEMLEVIVEPSYIYAGDEVSSSSDSWDRMISSLHLSSSGASFVSMLLKAELGDQIMEKKPEKKRCRAGPLARAMWGNPNGVRDSLKAILKLFVESWLQYGHYVLCDVYTIKPEDGGPSAFAIRSCRDEAKSMLKNLGTVVSYSLWLYSVCEGIRMNNGDLAYMLKEIYELESGRGTFDPLVFMSTKEVPAAYWKKLKLRLVLSLDAELVDSIQGNLAKQLGIDKEYKSVIR